MLIEGPPGPEGPAVSKKLHLKVFLVFIFSSDITVMACLRISKHGSLFYFRAYRVLRVLLDLLAPWVTQERG